MSLTVSDAAVAGWATALTSDAGLLSASWKLKRWTREAIEQLRVGFDGERYTFPVYANGKRNGLTALVRYAPSALLQPDQPKSLALAGSTRNLYPAPESIDGLTVWLVEGEADAVTATSAGLPAVAVPGTQGWKREWATRFAGMDCVVCFDCDSEGQLAAARIADDLAPVAESVRIVRLANRRDGFDLGDFLADAETPEQLVGARVLLEQMAEHADPVLPPPSRLPDGPMTVNAASVRPQRISWLWYGRIPRSAITLLLGMPGLGKSMLTCKVAADATKQAEGVLIMTAEDLIAETVVPRLKAEQADLALINFLSMRRSGFEESLRLPDDVQHLERVVRETNTKLVIIDPLAAHFGRDVDSFRDQSVRTALAPLKGIAERTGCVILIVAHLNKGVSNDPILRAGGSVGIIGAARSALLLDRDPADPDGSEGDQRILAQAKLNLAKFAPSLAYTIEGIYLEDHPDIDTARLVCTGESSLGSRELLGAPADRAEQTKLEEAIEWLEAELAEGPVAVQSLKSKCQREGFKWATVEKAKQALDVQTDRVGFGSESIYSWRLPEYDTDEDDAG